MQNKDPDRTDSIDADFQKRIREDTKRIIRYVDEIGPTDARVGLKLLYRKILDDLSINATRWKTLMDTYLRDPINGILNNTEEHVQQRSALNKNLVTNDQMTWKVFLRGLRFIRVKRLRFSVTLVHSNDTTTEHGMWLNIRNNYTPLDDYDDPRSTYNRIPVLEVRDDSKSNLAEVPADATVRGVITAPPPIDFDKYRTQYPVLGDKAEDK